MKNIIFFLFFSFFKYISHAQDGTVAQFAIWKIKPGATQQFEEGYKKHLDWHRTNNDPWNWYGWYFSSGPRSDQFLDATFFHSWIDFDHSVNPDGDGKDNGLHTEPFADFISLFRAVVIKGLHSKDSLLLQSRYIKLFTIDVTDIDSFMPVLQNFRENYIIKKNIDRYMFLKITDGDKLNRLLLLIGAENFKAFGLTEDLPGALVSYVRKEKQTQLVSIKAEQLRFHPGMSLLQ